MSARPLSIVWARRTLKNGKSETLHFKKGVNVIVGEPNTGKTRWLETIDFVLGDDNKAEDKLGTAVFSKYTAATVLLEIGDNQFVVERRWHETGAKTKVFVDEQSFDVIEFRGWLMDRLGIPRLHYPQGNPTLKRSWPELGWRSLLRHLYRRQRFWSDLADAQPVSEQHACITQFLGIAETLFSKEYGQLVEQQREISDLETRRAQFYEMLSEVTREIVSEDELGVAVTPDALTSATTRLNDDIAKLNGDRKRLIEAAMASVAPTPSQPADSVSRMTEEFALAKEREKSLCVELARVNTRIQEVTDFQQQVMGEVSRLKRASKAGEILADLKVTHCPACDQAIATETTSEAACYVCGQATGSVIHSPADAARRLEFEIEQLEGERKENGELLATLSEQRVEHQAEIQKLRSACAKLAEQLRPIRTATSAIIPIEVSQIDHEIGGRVERIDQLRRIRESLSLREVIAKKIARLQEQVEALQKLVDSQMEKIEFHSVSDLISDGMNEYVSKLRYGDTSMWSQKAISVTVKAETFKVKIGKVSWTSQLGGTMSIYLLLSYHYSLLKLSREPTCNSPGFLMLDFPAEIEGAKVADHENFAIEPFIELCDQPQFKHLQIIAAGSAFESLQGVHRMEFQEVWG